MDTPHPAEPSADRRASNTVTAVVGLAVVALALVFVFNTNVFTSDWYAFFKWVHVTGAVLWVGGGLTLTILALKAERSSEPAEMAMIARQAAFVGERVFAPVGLLVLLAGIGMVVNLHLGLGNLLDRHRPGRLRDHVPDRPPRARPAGEAHRTADRDRGR